nr:MAG TPA: hypothetical protein [Caudoviricetes sp.]
MDYSPQDCLLNSFTSNYIIWLFHLLRTCQSTH